MARPKKKKTEPAGEELVGSVLPPLNSHLGEFDVELVFDVQLKTRDGSVAQVNGTMPINNALVPVFLKDSLHTVDDSFKKLVADRFGLQLRHYFNSRLETEMQQALPKPPESLKSSGAALELLSSAPKDGDPHFTFEAQDDEPEPKPEPKKSLEETTEQEDNSGELPEVIID